MSPAVQDDNPVPPLLVATTPVTLAALPLMFVLPNAVEICAPVATLNALVPLP